MWDRLSSRSSCRKNALLTDWKVRPPDFFNSLLARRGYADTLSIDGHLHGADVRGVVQRRRLDGLTNAAERVGQALVARTNGDLSPDGTHELLGARAHASVVRQDQHVRAEIAAVE